MKSADLAGSALLYGQLGQSVCHRASHADRICAVQEEAYTVIAEARGCTHKENVLLR